MKYLTFWYLLQLYCSVLFIQSWLWDRQNLADQTVAFVHDHGRSLFNSLKGIVILLLFYVLFIQSWLEQTGLGRPNGCLCPKVQEGIISQKILSLKFSNLLVHDSGFNLISVEYSSFPIFCLKIQKLDISNLGRPNSSLCPKVQAISKLFKSSTLVILKL